MLSRFWKPLVFLAVFLFAVFGCSGKGSEADAGQKFAKAPSFTLKDLKGNNVSLSDFKGKVVVLDFWAPWCPPCRNALPHLIDLQKRYGGAGVTVLGMSIDSDSPDFDALVKKTPFNYKLLHCDFDTKSAYGISSIPRMFVVDKNGDIRADFTGFGPDTGKQLEAKVVELL